MMAAAQGNSLLIEGETDVCGSKTFDRKGDDAAAMTSVSDSSQRWFNGRYQLLSYSRPIVHQTPATDRRSGRRSRDTSDAFESPIH
jgi:hypothetical protein